MARCYRTMVSTWMWLPKQLLVWPTLVTVLASRIVTIVIIPRGGAPTTTTTATMLAAAGVLLLFFRRKMAASASKSSSTAKTPLLLSRPRLAGVVVVGAAVVGAIYQAVGMALRGSDPSSASEIPSTLVETVRTTAWASFRCSLAAALLGWTVLGRYTGPRSCHRMSSCLLGACVHSFVFLLLVAILLSRSQPSLDALCFFFLFAVMNPVGELVWTLWNRPVALFGPGDGHDGILILGGLFRSRRNEAAAAAQQSSSGAHPPHLFSPNGSSRPAQHVLHPAAPLVGGSHDGAMMTPRQPRYLYVTVAQGAAQLVTCLVVGCAVAILVGPSTASNGPHAAAASRWHVQVTLAAVSAVTMVMLRSLVGTGNGSASPSCAASHELSPSQCLATQPRLEAALGDWTGYVRRSLAVGTASALVATGLTSSRVVAVVTMITGGWEYADPTSAQEGSVPSGTTLATYLCLAAYGSVLALYVMVLDEGVRLALFDRFRVLCEAPGDVDDLIEELSSASVASPMTVVGRKDSDGDIPSIPSLKLELLLTAVLQSDDLVREVAARTPYAGSGGGGGRMTGEDNEPGRHEREEKRRVHESARTLGELLVDPSRGLSHPEAPWEEDVLRAALWQALANGSVTEEWFGGRQGQIQRAIGIDERRRNGGLDPMYAVPLVRALCVHVRGMGDALLTCASPVRNGTPYGVGVGAALQRWYMPPGFESAAVCSLRALSNFLVDNMVEMNHTTGWKSSVLAPFVPIALSSMHCLRRGVLAFEVPPPVQVVMDGRDMHKEEGALVAQRPAVSSLVQACDECAVRVVMSIQLPQGHPLASRNSLRLEDECSLWVTTLLAAPVRQAL
jgi:hypothetical protein